jgi:hypothetical protein
VTSDVRRREPCPGIAAVLELDAEHRLRAAVLGEVARRYVAVVEEARIEDDARVEAGRVEKLDLSRGVLLARGVDGACARAEADHVLLLDLEFVHRRLSPVPGGPQPAKRTPRPEEAVLVGAETGSVRAGGAR